MEAFHHYFLQLHSLQLSELIPSGRNDAAAGGGIEVEEEEGTDDDDDKGAPHLDCLGC